MSAIQDRRLTRVIGRMRKATCVFSNLEVLPGRAPWAIPSAMKDFCRSEVGGEGREARRKSLPSASPNKRAAYGGHHHSKRRFSAPWMRGLGSPARGRRGKPRPPRAPPCPERGRPSSVTARRSSVYGRPITKRARTRRGIAVTFAATPPIMLPVFSRLGRMCRPATPGHHAPRSFTGPMRTYLRASRRLRGLARA